MRCQGFFSRALTSKTAHAAPRLLTVWNWFSAGCLTRGTPHNALLQRSQEDLRLGKTMLLRDPLFYWAGCKNTVITHQLAMAPLTMCQVFQRTPGMDTVRTNLCNQLVRNHRERVHIRVMIGFVASQDFWRRPKGNFLFDAGKACAGH